MPQLDEQSAAWLAALALAALGREYPNHLQHFLNGAGDAQTPRALHPAFYGALDWHSAVHNHWLLACLARRFPDAAFALKAGKLLAQNLTDENIAGECNYFRAPGREGFERPYGWAWLLALDAELGAFPPQRAALAPLTELVAGRIGAWLAALPWPLRSGEHANTAFALGLMFDWAAATRHGAVATAIATAAKRFYLRDCAAPLAFEPSGHDFLSPVLAEADLMGRILEPSAFADWFKDFLPTLREGSDAAWLPVVESPDSLDYKLAHLVGLNLSRAWMLAAIAARLPARDRRRAALAAAAEAHAADGLAGAERSDYGASHWVPTFAVYLLRNT